jgi:hypothetical protein
MLSASDNEAPVLASPSECESFAPIGSSHSLGGATCRNKARTVWDHSPSKQPDSPLSGALQHITGDWVSYRHERGITHVERRYVCSSKVGHIRTGASFVDMSVVTADGGALMLVLRWKADDFPAVLR